MKERIRQLMEAQHMNQQTFAQLTGIGAASLSSIFNGRTEPTLRHVEAIRKRFPNINLGWLLTGDGGMFVPASNPDEAKGGVADDTPGMNRTNADIVAEGTLDFVTDDETSPVTPAPAVSPVTAPVSQGQRQTARSYQQPAHALNTSRHQGIALQATAARRITEIRVFYDDQTWESFVPKK